MPEEVYVSASCQRCNASSTDEGFLYVDDPPHIDRAIRRARRVEWAPGHDWISRRADEYPRAEVVVERCNRCGHLEFVAPRISHGD